MTREEFDAILADCIEDRKVSRGERRVLSELLGEGGLARNELDLLRSRAFAMAADAVADPNAREILGWVEDIVGLLAAAGAPARTARPAVAYFSPHDDCVAKVAQLFRAARKAVEICVFTITDNRITRAIEQAHKRGVKVRIVSDDEKSSDPGSDVVRLATAGVPIVFDDSDDHMHHKFAIFDQHTLLTGSYNWTRNAAEANHENFIVVEDPKLVAAFHEEFERLWVRYA